VDELGERAEKGKDGEDVGLRSLLLTRARESFKDLLDEEAGEREEGGEKVSESNREGSVSEVQLEKLTVQRCMRKNTMSGI